MIVHSKDKLSNDKPNLLISLSCLKFSDSSVASMRGSARLFMSIPSSILTFTTPDIFCLTFYWPRTVDGQEIKTIRIQLKGDEVILTYPTAKQVLPNLFNLFMIACSRSRG